MKVEIELILFGLAAYDIELMFVYNTVQEDIVLGWCSICRHVNPFRIYGDESVVDEALAIEMGW